jgi:hypothetical protein
VTPWQYVAGGLAAALALSLGWGARVDHLRGDYKATLARTKRDYAEAQTKAQATFDTQIAALQTHNRRLNDAAQKQSDDLRIVYRDRVIRLPAATAQCITDGSAMPLPGDAGSPHRTSGDTVLLKRADALICATNTARLEAARDWALSWKHGPTPESGIIPD